MLFSRYNKLRLYFKNGTVKFFLIVEFDKQDNMQLLAKFKKILYMGFRATLKLRVFLLGHSVAMVTYCITKITRTCSPVTGQFFDTMIVASIDSGNYDPSRSVSWKVPETVLSHLKHTFTKKVEW